MGPRAERAGVDGPLAVGSRDVIETMASQAGWVIRNDIGVYLGAVQAKGKVVQIAFEGECQGLIMAMQHCWSRGYQKIIFESDCQKLINAINGKVLHFNRYNWIREIRWWSRKFEDDRFSWIGRDRNQIADKLAKEHILLGNTFYFHFCPLVSITGFLHNDYVQTISS